MRASDIQRAAAREGADLGLLCWAIRTVLPILRRAREEASGWKFWQRWGMDALIHALEAYVRGSCPG